MTSFIELPRLAFGGRAQPSFYVNVADIIGFQALWDGQTQVEIRDMGNEHYPARVTTYVPVDSLLDLLGELSKNPGVRSWAASVKEAWAAPIAALLEESAERERAAR